MTANSTKLIGDQLRQASIQGVSQVYCFGDWGANFLASWYWGLFGTTVLHYFLLHIAFFFDTLGFTGCIVVVFLSLYIVYCSTSVSPRETGSSIRRAKHQAAFHERLIANVNYDNDTR